MAGSRSKYQTLTLAAIGLWLVAAGPAYLLAGSLGIEGLTYALLICAAPGFVVLLATERGREGFGALRGLLVGMGLRLATALIATFVLHEFRPDLGLLEFHVWLVVAYLVMLAVETRLLLAQDRQSPSGPRAAMMN
jgi:hypothetical protein